MLGRGPDRVYADIMEQALYNGALSGLSTDGATFFYDNPLESRGTHHRWTWHRCPCCPPMFLKIMGALPGYVYATDNEDLYVNLYVGSRAEVHLGNAKLQIVQATKYPWDGTVRLTFAPSQPSEFAVNLRIPSWAVSPAIKVNNQAIGDFPIESGYAVLKRTWKSGDVLDLQMPMAPARTYAHPKVKANAGRVAIQRGPIVYCLEGLDHSQRVRDLVLPAGGSWQAEHRAELLGGVTVVTGPAMKLAAADWADQLYASANRLPGVKPLQFTAIPYYANANRGPSEMLVWAAENRERCAPLGLAAEAKVKASHCNSGDTTHALHDGIEPRHSADESVPRFTWWDHRGTAEWVEYDFERPVRVGSAEVYWWDERNVNRHCRVPRSWRLLYRTETEWREVKNREGYRSEIDRYNRVDFEPVETSALRLEAQLQPEWSGGILEWKLAPAGK
jgi:hypothetical protein